MKYKCCTCGEELEDFNAAKEHRKASREHGYVAHFVVNVDHCIMCPAQESCGVKEGCNKGKPKRTVKSPEGKGTITRSAAAKAARKVTKKR